MKIKGNILVVDDNQEIYKQICNFLSRGKYMVEYARNVEEAESKLRFDNYDIIFLDLVLPGLSGLEIIEDIKKIKGNIPEIVLMTAYHAEELEKQALELGAVSCMHKPLDEIEVKTIIEEYFDRKNRQTTQETQV